MKASQILAVFGFTTLALAQSESLAPSPTESTGCEPHGDHYTSPPHPSPHPNNIIWVKKPVHKRFANTHARHCEAARPTNPAAISSGTTLSTAVAVTTTATATVTNDHDHDHDDDHTNTAGSLSLAPSPTEFIGCEPHGDHWHCDGPATAAVSGSATATATVAVTTTAPASTGVAATTTAVPAGAGRAGFGAAAIAVALMAL